MHTSVLASCPNTSWETQAWATHAGHKSCRAHHKRTLLQIRLAACKCDTQMSALAEQQAQPHGNPRALPPSLHVTTFHLTDSSSAAENKQVDCEWYATGRRGRQPRELAGSWRADLLLIPLDAAGLAAPAALRG